MGRALRPTPPAPPPLYSSSFSLPPPISPARDKMGLTSMKLSGIKPDPPQQPNSLPLWVGLYARHPLPLRPSASASHLASSRPDAAHLNETIGHKARPTSATEQPTAVGRALSPTPPAPPPPYSSSFSLPSPVSPTRDQTQLTSMKLSGLEPDPPQQPNSLPPWVGLYARHPLPLEPSSKSPSA